jgi:probable HAF family extracellular repeat protein
VGDQETPAADRAWMYQQSSGALSELTFDPAESGASAKGISDSGVIAGEEISAQSGLQAGFWTVTGGAMLLSGQFAGSEWAVAANDNGAVLGDYGASGSPGSAALLWSAPGYAQATLPGLRCDHCDRLMISANAINASGTAVGQSQSSVYDNGTLVSGGLFAVEWQAGTVTSLGSLQDSGTSAAYGINSGGDIVGSSRVGQASGAPSHAFLYRQGAMLDLGVLQGDANSSADSINDSGQIVGVSSDAAGAQRAFLYQNGQMLDLNALIDPASPLIGRVSLQEAVGISANGWIAVNGTDSQDPGWTRAFLLIPSR